MQILGLFLEKLNSNMDPEGGGVVKEKFGPEEFQSSCDPRHLGKKVSEAHDTFDAVVTDSVDSVARKFFTFTELCF